MRALPDISIRQLEYLVAVAEAPTWAIAAGEVGVSASALSQGLAELERRIGVALFEPAGRSRSLRVSALPVLDHARQVIGLTNDLVDWSDRLRGSRSGRVRLGMIDVAAVVHFAHALHAFRAARPDVELTLTVAPSRRLLEQLAGGELDLAVCVEPPEPVVGVETVEVMREPLVVYGPPGTVIGPPEGWGPWVVFPADSHTRRRVDARLRSLGATVDIAAESHQPDVLREMVRLGLGWTVLPESQGGTGELSVGPQLLERSLVTARRRGAISDPAVDALAETLIEAPGPRRDHNAINVTD